MRIEKAKDLKDALSLLAQGARPMAGCTNILVDRKRTPDPDAFYADISGLPELKGIRETEEEILIGAAVTFAELLSSGRGDYIRALSEAAAAMGGPQIRNRATVAGNICDASPACDAGPALLALDASVTAVSEAGERRIPVSEFFKGVRKTALDPAELAVSIRIPKAAGRSFFYKAGNRSALAISVASLAGKQYPDGTVRLAMGSVNDRPVRLYGCEEAVRAGLSAEEILSALEKDIAPISDLRASAEYRRAVAGNLLIKALRKEFAYGNI